MCRRVALVKVRVGHVIVQQKVDKQCRPVPRVKQMTAISQCTATRTIDYFDVEGLSASLGSAVLNAPSGLSSEMMIRAGLTV